MKRKIPDNDLLLLTPRNITVLLVKAPGDIFVGFHFTKREQDKGHDQIMNKK